jgi:glyoxylase I family protein
MSVKDTLKEYAFIMKLDVSNLEESARWYKDRLGLIHDPRFDTPTWRQFNLPDIKRVAIGLNVDPPKVGTGGAVATFIVEDIVASREALTRQDIQVGPILDPGHDVKLCFFNDPDGNALGLRQNPPHHPHPRQLGS